MQPVAPSSQHPCPCSAPLPCLPHHSNLTLILSPSTPLSSHLKSLLPKIPGSATIAPLSCQDNSMHDASVVNPVLGTTHRWTCRLLILGLSLSLSYVPYHSFTLNSSALPFFLSLFLLSPGHSTTPLLLQPCACCRTFGYNTFVFLEFGYQNFLNSSPCGSVTSETNPHRFHLLFHFCLHFIVAYLFYDIGPMSYKYPSPGSVNARQLWPFPLSVFVCILTSTFDNQPANSTCCIRNAILCLVHSHHSCHLLTFTGHFTTCY